MVENKVISAEVQTFKSAFADKKNQKIVIYGTGIKTAKLLTGIADWNIIGLLDRDTSLVGKVIYGKKVIDRITAEAEADLLIINTAEIYWNTIYDRIKDWEIPIYFNNGQQAIDVNETNFAADIYYEKTIGDLEKQIEKYDVISFDIFETLIMRSVFLPADIFKLVEKRAEKSLNLPFSFAEQRIKAVGELDNPTYTEIYAKMQALTQSDEELIESLKQLEWVIDLNSIVARTDMIELCKKVMKEKTVYFISDMYYTSEMLQEILAKNGLEVAKNRIIVSCEQRKSKMQGTLWKYYREDIVGESIALHIGDNEKSDVQNPLRYGIDTYYVRSAIQMLENSSLRKIIPKINSLYSSIVMGLVMSKIFNSPFALQKARGRICFISEEETGYCLLGSLCFSFCYWLLNNSRQDSIKKLLFFAREGYLLIEQYQWLCEFWKEISFPRPIYLEISRRAVINASVKSKEEIYEIINFYPYDGNLKCFLRERFGVEVEADANNCSLSVLEMNRNKQAFRTQMKEYEDKIFAEIRKERSNYIKYLKTVGINDKEKIGIVDSWLRGSTQFYLGRILQERLQGYYFTICLESNDYTEEQNMKSCFAKKDDMSGKQAFVWKNSNFLESFFTSPKGMLLYIDENGNGKYAKSMSNQKHFDVRIQMQMGVLRFFEDFLHMCEDVDFERIPQDSEFADELLGCFMNLGFEPSKIMKNSFYCDNGMLNDREAPIW